MTDGLTPGLELQYHEKVLDDQGTIAYHTF